MAEKHKKGKPLGTNLLHKDIEFNPLYWIVFIGLLGIIFFTPYFRGLFFSTEQQPVLIIAAVLFGLWWFYNMFKFKRLDIFNNHLDFVVLGLFLVYVISAFTAVNQGLAVNEVVKNAIYVFVFLLASRLLINEQKVYILLNVVVLSAVGVSMAGILTGMEWVQVHEGFVGNRIYSTMQYPNALASYLLAVFLLCLALWNRSEGAGSFLYSSFNYIIFITILGTNSRGILVLLPIIFLLSLLNPYNRKVASIFAHWVFIGLGAVVGSIGLIPSILDGNVGAAWLWFFAGLAVALAGQLGWNYLERKRAAFKLGRKHIFAGILAVVVILMFSWNIVLPEHMVQRIESIQITERDAESRIYWSLEAVEIGGKSPILGHGGGAWEASYQHFQDYFYLSTQVHNHFAQTFVEVGIIGLIFFVSLWLVMLYLGFQNLKVMPERIGNVQWLIMVAALSLGAHALIDFDLSLSSIAILLWSLLGITAAFYRWNFPVKMFTARPVAWGALGVFVLMLIMLPAGLMSAQESIESGIASANQGELEEAENHLKKAVRMNPFDPDHRLNLALLYNHIEEYDKAVEQAEIAVKLDKYGWETHRGAAGIFWTAEEYEKAVNHYEIARDNYRWNEDRWGDLSRAYGEKGLMLLEEGERENTEEYLRLAAAVPKEIAAKVAELDETERRRWSSRADLLEPPAESYLYAGIGEYFTGDIELAGEYLEEAARGEEEDAFLWLTFVLSELGEHEKVNDYMEEAMDKHPDFGRKYRKTAELIENWFGELPEHEDED